MTWGADDDKLLCIRNFFRQLERILESLVGAGIILI